MKGRPKYKLGTEVSFKEFNGTILRGEIYIVDAYGTFFDPSDASYDIIVNKDTEDACLYKHIPESWIIKRHNKKKSKTNDNKETME